MNASDYIRQLGLLPHPEGGYYRETYRSKGNIPPGALPAFPVSERQWSTAIYFLLQAGDFSAFHRIQSDECWHFYAGGPLLIHVLNQEGLVETATLGNNILQSQHLQFVVAANLWFASEPAPGTDFSLVGCTVAPGFDFADFEMASAAELLASYPEQSDLIRRLTRA